MLKNSSFLLRKNAVQKRYMVCKAVASRHTQSFVQSYSKKFPAVSENYVNSIYIFHVSNVVLVNRLKDLKVVTSSSHMAVLSTARQKISFANVSKNALVDFEYPYWKKYVRPNKIQFSTRGDKNSVMEHKNVQLTITKLKPTLFHKNGTSPLLRGVTKTSNVLNRLFSTISDDCKEREDTPSVPSTNSDRLYVNPKNILHNAFDTVAQQQGNRDLRLQPTYNIVKGKGKNSSWCCTYNLKWPETMKFTATARTKQEASHHAAIEALLWLKKMQKITKDGCPITIEKTEIKELIRKSQTTLILDPDSVAHMKQVSDIYKNHFVPELTRSVDTKREPIGILEDGDDVDTHNLNKSPGIKKVFGSPKYLAKEKIHLPISKYKEQFMQMLKENRIIIIKGEPGCGKSTRIPQYVLELWAKESLQQGELCQIAVTQPRRIAAISLADRVSDERNEKCGHIVGYQVRLRTNYNPMTGRILYCTTGILLKYLQTDINLTNFTHVILDEAHERDVNTDLLLNLLKRALEKNSKLKLIVMSATVDVDLFVNYLNNPAVMHIPGFTYPVKSHFLDDLKGLHLSGSSNYEIASVVHEDVVKLILHLHKTQKEGAILCFLPGWEDITRVEKLIPKYSDLAVLCLHSRLQDSDQRRIFSRMPPGVRKVILSTNISETSVTIDDVVYVIDTGIHKESRFDTEKGVTCIDNYWISQSSMAQRRGRAGRVQPGESFHLYPRAQFESFSKFTDPEILKTSLTKIVLNSKVYSNNMDAIEFMSHLPSPPDKTATRRAVSELKDLKLLEENENLTPLGRTLAKFQLEPKLAKILVNSVVYKCVTPIVDIVTIFSADTELFSNALVDKEGIKRIKAEGSKNSDHLAMMRFFEAWLELMEESGEETAARYCVDANLVHRKLLTLNKLRKIHFDYLNNLHGVLPVADHYSDNDELVKAILFSAVGNLLRHRNWDIVKGRMKKSNVFLTNYNQKATIASESVNFKKTSFSSNFLVYFNEVRSNIRRTTVIRETSVIPPISVLLFSDKELITTELDSDKLMLSLKNTKVEFCCLKEDAGHVKNCKEALDSIYQYFIFQLTEGGECNSQINQIWDQILQHVDSLLLKHSIK